MMLSFLFLIFNAFFDLDVITYNEGDSIFVKLSRWSEYDHRSPYPQENDHCLFKGIINALFISKRREYYVFIAFEGYEDIIFPSFTNEYCVNDTTEYEVISKAMYDEFELGTLPNAVDVSSLSEDM